MKIEIEVINEFTVLGLSGRIDATNFNDFQSQLSEIIKKGNTKILLDCKSLSYISSSGLRIFLQIQKEINSSSGNLKFCNLSEPIKELFDIAGFTSIFEIFNNRDDAFGKNNSNLKN